MSVRGNFARGTARGLLTSALCKQRPYLRLLPLGRFRIKLVPLLGGDSISPVEFPSWESIDCLRCSKCSQTEMEIANTSANRTGPAFP